MKHHDPLRPIGKCKGCCLNLRVSCAAHLRPKSAWAKGRCKHYNDQQLLAASRDPQALTGAALARRRRKARAEQAATEPHYNGVLDPGKMAGRAKRKGATA